MTCRAQVPATGPCASGLAAPTRGVLHWGPRDEMGGTVRPGHADRAPAGVLLRGSIARAPGTRTPGNLSSPIVTQSAEAGVLIGVRRVRGARDRAGTLGGLVITHRAVENGTQPLTARGFLQHPGPVLPGRIMTHMLPMAALEEGDPLELRVLLESGNATVHVVEDSEPDAVGGRLPPPRGTPQRRAYRARRSRVRVRSRAAANACRARASYGGGPPVTAPAVRS